MNCGFVPRPSNGKIFINKSPVVSGPYRQFPLHTTLTFVCDDGYTLQGAKTAICDKWGAWAYFDAFPVCKSKEIEI